MTDVPELLARSLEDRSIEAAVLCIEGCGTSIINDPAVMRRAGPFITGSDRIVPDEGIVSIVGDDNVLDPETGKVDNVEGLCVVYDSGIHRAAATTGSLKEAQMMRDMFGSDLLIIGYLDSFPERDRGDSKGLLDVVVSGGAVALSPLGEDLLNKR
jgi:hypothetical protein